MPSITKKEYERLVAAEEVCYGLMILISIGLLNGVEEGTRTIIYKDLEKWLDLEPEGIKQEIPKETVKS